MSEKTMRDGECAKCGGNLTTDHKCPDVYHTRVTAAPEIVPLLARIARLEKDLSMFAISTPARERELQRQRDAAESERNQLRGEVERLTEELSSAKSSVEGHIAQVKSEAYQRGVAAERERWKTAAIAEKAKYDVDHAFDCGARTACDNILDVYRSAPPAVEVAVCEWKLTGPMGQPWVSGCQHLASKAPAGAFCSWCGKRVEIKS